MNYTKPFLSQVSIRKESRFLLKQLSYIDISEDTTINLLTDQSGISSPFIFAAA